MRVATRAIAVYWSATWIDAERIHPSGPGELLAVVLVREWVNLWGGSCILCLGGMRRVAVHGRDFQVFRPWTRIETDALGNQRRNRFT